MGKNSLNNIICHLWWLKKLCPYSYTSPHIHSWIFDSLWIIIFWVRVTHKMLNVNWEKFHSIILSVTCHGLRNFAPTHTHPLISICEFSKPYKLLFFELESPIKSWMWIPLHDPPIPPYMTHPTPPHPFMTHPPHPTPPHPFMTHPPHPFMTHPPHPTPHLHDPPSPLVHFWAQRSLFHGLLHYVSLSVDKNSDLTKHLGFNDDPLSRGPPRWQLLMRPRLKNVSWIRQWQSERPHAVIWGFLNSSSAGKFA